MTDGQPIFNRQVACGFRLCFAFPDLRQVVHSGPQIHFQEATMEIHKLLCTRKEAASTLSISLRMLDEMIDRRELRPRRVGRRVLIQRRELERFASCDHVNGAPERDK